MLNAAIMEKINNRDDISGSSKRIIFELFEEINNTTIARTYGANENIKKLLDKGEYDEARALSEVFGDITNACKSNKGYIEKILNELPLEEK